MGMSQPFTSALAVPITVGTNTWQMYVYHAVCRDDSWVVDLVLVGPQTHTLRISTEARQEPRIAAQTVVGLAREWLLSQNQKES
jgi:hypothetical protein